MLEVEMLAVLMLFSGNWEHSTAVTLSFNKKSHCGPWDSCIYFYRVQHTYVLFRVFKVYCSLAVGPSWKRTRKNEVMNWVIGTIQCNLVDDS